MTDTLRCLLEHPEIKLFVRVHMDYNRKELEGCEVLEPKHALLGKGWGWYFHKSILEMHLQLGARPDRRKMKPDLKLMV